MGYLAMLLEPSISVAYSDKSDDVMRHYFRFENYDLNKSFFDNLSGYPDLILPLIYFFGKLLNLKKEIIPFFSVFISYFVILKIFYELFKKKSNNTNLFLLYLVLFFSVEFRSCALNIRNFPAICLMTYGMFLYFNNNQKIKSIIFILFANMMHISTLMITMIFILYLLLAKIYFFKKYFYIFFILSIIIAFMPMKIIINFILYCYPIIPEFIKKPLESYILGYNAFEYLSDTSTKGLIYIYLKQTIKIGVTIYIVLFLRQKIKNKKLYCFLLFSTSCIFILYPLPSLFNRYIDFSFLLATITFCIYINETNRIDFKLLFTILLALFILAIADIYATRYLLEATLPKLLYPTIYNILFDSIPYKNWLYYFPS